MIKKQKTRCANQRGNQANLALTNDEIALMNNENDLN